MSVPWALAVLLGLAQVPRGALAAAQYRGHNLSPFVIFGIGDSGTGSVKRLLENFGVQMCGYQKCDKECRQRKDARKTLRGKKIDKKRRNDGLGSQDNYHTKGTHEYIKGLLKSSAGRVSQPTGYGKSRKFGPAVEEELKGAMRTLDCILQQRQEPEKFLESTGWTRAVEPVSEQFAWGYKNPNHVYLLPVMDQAFNRTQRMLAVARDPRDICTGNNQNQFKKYGKLVAKRRRIKRTRGKGAAMCFQFWANMWDDLLQEYGKDPRFRVVRTEDLVLPDPALKGNGATKTLGCVLKHAHVPPATPESALSWLTLMHNHTDSYTGSRLSASQKEFLVHATKLLNTTRFGDVMRLLGYRSDVYGVGKPEHASVCK